MSHRAGHVIISSMRSVATTENTTAEERTRLVELEAKTEADQECSLLERWFVLRLANRLLQ